MIKHGFIYFLISFGDRLRVPEIVSIVKRNEVVNLLKHFVVAIVFSSEEFEELFDFVLVSDFARNLFPQRLLCVGIYLNSEFGLHKGYRVFGLFSVNLLNFTFL